MKYDFQYPVFIYNENDVCLNPKTYNFKIKHNNKVISISITTGIVQGGGWNYGCNVSSYLWGCTFAVYLDSKSFSSENEAFNTAIDYTFSYCQSHEGMENILLSVFEAHKQGVQQLELF